MKSLVDIAKQVAKGKRPTSLGFSSSGDLNLFQISVETQGDYVTKKLNDAGFKYASEDISKKLDKLTAKLLNSLTEYATAAAKSKVPYREGILRNAIKSTGSPYSGPHTVGRFKSGSLSTLVRTVYVEGSAHSPNYSKFGSKFYFSSTLGAWKNNALEKRSQNSLAEPGFTSISKGQYSQGWIKSAQAAFNAGKGNVVNKILLSK